MVSPSLLEQSLIGFKFDPSLDFDDLVEAVHGSVVPPASSMPDEELDEEATDQLLVAASQAYEKISATSLIGPSHEQEIDELLLAASQQFESIDQTVV